MGTTQEFVPSSQYISSPTSFQSLVSAEVCYAT